MENNLYVYGNLIPQDITQELINIYGIEKLTKEFIETLFYYDNEDNK